MALNRVILMGRLVADPVLRRTQDGKPVTSFRIAVERDYPDQNGNRPADFFSITTWRQAELVDKHFKKGTMAIVEGRLVSNYWQDQRGNKRVSIEVEADNVRFGETKKAAQAAAAPAPSNQPDGGYSGMPDYTGENFDAIDRMENAEDVPF